MRRVVKVHEAKTNLSALLAAVEAGDEVIIARGSSPVARLVPYARTGERTLGFLRLSLPEDAFAPLDDEEQAVWDGSAG